MTSSRHDVAAAINPQTKMMETSLNAMPINLA